MDRIRSLQKEIVGSNRDIDAMVKKKTESLVTEEMECTGASRSQAYSNLHDKIYRGEMDRIKGLSLKKQMAEVELFIISEQPFTSSVKEG